MTRLSSLLLVVSALAVAPPGARTGEPRIPRARMEALARGGCWKLVVGTRDPALAPLLRERALALARRLPGGDTTIVVPDTLVRAEDLAPCGVALFGGPEQNAWTARWAARLPLAFHRGGFRWAGRDYDRPGDAIHLVFPSPIEPRRFLLLIAANSAEALGGEAGELLFGNEDWRIYREGVRRRSGVFAQDPERPWRYDPALDRDRDEDARRFEAGLIARTAAGVVVRAPAGLALAEAVPAAASRLLARLDRMGLGAAGPVTLTLYRSLEEKGAILGDTRPEQLVEGAAHAAPVAGREGLDLGVVAAARLVRAGADPSSPWLEPAAAALCGRFDGEPLELALARLYYGGVLPSPRAAAGPGGSRSIRIGTPARALLLLAVRDAAAGRARSALLATLGPRTPQSLDALSRAAALAPAELERRYRGLADSLARAGRTAMLVRAAKSWAPADGFQRGATLEPEAGAARGYLSAACGRELQRLRVMGVDWVSFAPTAVWSSADSRIAFGMVGDPDEASDESLAEAAARAHVLGLRVWLAPRLWTRGGELSLGPEGWNRFFEEQRAMLLHLALLAERERIEGLIVGHELGAASARSPERWRATLAEVRKIYHGTLTYDAGSVDEARAVGFWDALDLIGVSFRAPLASKPTTSAAALLAGARAQLEALRPVAVRARRPLLLAEVGYAAERNAPVRPWEEGTGPDAPESQRACIQAVIDALQGEEWVAGALWGSWSSDGREDRAFSPRGRPAESALRRAFESWRGRAVHPPLSAPR